MLCRIKVYAGTSGIVSEYDQEIPQSQTADNHVASRGRAAFLTNKVPVFNGEQK